MTPRQALQRPSPRSRGSGLPSPVLKLAWQRMQTYIFELDIIGLTPGSAFGLAAVYSACVWRSFGAVGDTGGAAVRRVAMALNGREGPLMDANLLLSLQTHPPAASLPKS